MRIIYNEDLNKRIIPYVDKLIKNKKKLDKETAVLFDVFIQYLAVSYTHLTLPTKA